jgi:NADPH:quinone reductase-like Zn-dependent oxidoreductase
MITYEGLMGGKIPSTMRTILLSALHENVEEAIQGLAVITKPIPKPKSGQVLVKIEAAPCNPSDLLFLQGKYGKKKTLPAVPGWEGAGTVVASGGGLLGMWLKGKRVACGGQSDQDGTWAEYFIAEAGSCVPLKSNINIEDGATLLINPLTAVGMVQRAKEEGHAAIIQTAAASQVGRMVIKLASHAGIPSINIVHRDEQIDLLKSIGAEFVINSEKEDFISILKNESVRLKATIAFEAVGGEMTGRILNAMPPKSIVVVYGSLSQQPCGKINPIELIFGQKKVDSFWLTKWLTKKGFWGTFKGISQVQSLILSGEFKTPIQRRCGFQDFKEGLLAYHRSMTTGKVLLIPSND